MGDELAFLLILGLVILVFIAWHVRQIAASAKVSARFAPLIRHELFFLRRELTQHPNGPEWEAGPGNLHKILLASEEGNRLLSELNERLDDERTKLAVTAVTHAWKRWEEENRNEANRELGEF